MENLARPRLEGLLLVDTAFRIFSFDEVAEAVTGLPGEEWRGKDARELLLPEGTAGRHPLVGVIEKGEALEDVGCRVGEGRSLLLSATPLRKGGGEVVGAVVRLRDRDPLRTVDSIVRSATERLEIERSYIAAILSSIADGVFTVDPEWRITTFNPAAETITGYSAEEAIGRRCDEVFGSEICGEECPLKRSVRMGRSTINYPVAIRSRDGRRIPVSISTAAIRDPEGGFIGGVETFRDLSRIAALEEELEGRHRFGGIVGKSPVMREIYRMVENLAEVDVTVLIVGETGTGKELVARAVHARGPRAKSPFVAVNCSALPESLLESELFGHVRGAFTGAVTERAGRFETAEGGTILLDEVGEAPLSVQSKLLRVIERKEFERVGSSKTQRANVRILAATNRDLEAAIEGGSFRRDLFYRLNVVKIALPPLRERREDIPLLASHFLASLSHRMGKSIGGFSPETLDKLISYDWPGNIRELENAVERGFIHCDGEAILPQHLPPEVLGGGGVPRESAGEGERERILRILGEVRWNRGEAARRLGVSRTTLWKKMNRYKLGK